MPSLRHHRSLSVPDAGDKAEPKVDPCPCPEGFPSLSREFVNHQSDSKGRALGNHESVEQKPWV